MARDDAGALRVAIIGLGPKGLFALERLLDHARRAGARARLDVDLFEPHPVPGAGPVYDPGQPEYLRMNFAADQLDMWPADSRGVPAAQRRSFVDWRRALSGDCAEDEHYPPRAQVGRYLAEGLQAVLEHAPPAATVTLRPSAVGAVQRLDSIWRVVTADEATHDYDEILVAIGHGTWDDEGPARAWTHAAPLVPTAFPVARRLSHERVASGATVAVRGFALTFIDVALALTEGRGGAFEGGAHPYRLRYEPSGREAGVIVPFSRSGRPMLAKPDPALTAAIPALEALAQSGRERILALGEAFDLRDDLLAILASTSGACLLVANDHRPAGAPLRSETSVAADCLAAACGGLAPVTAFTPAAELERSLAVGAGLHAPDLQWALGHSWRSLYPALVQRLGAGGLADHDWPAFRRLAAQMERVAFGPPPLNAAKLLALIAARRIDLSHVGAGQITTADGATSIGVERADCPLDVVVDAVLPGPGSRHGDGGLLAQLVADGHGRILSGRRGLQVSADANCIGADGHRTRGLSAIGRASEDCVIGNDTLNRTLHPHADGWARRVARRSASHAASPPVALAARQVA